MIRTPEGQVSFAKWLEQYLDEDSPFGDLARGLALDVRMGGTPPLETSLFTPWYSYLASTVALDAFVEAFVLYEFAIYGPEVHRYHL